MNLRFYPSHRAALQAFEDFARQAAKTQQNYTANFQRMLFQASDGSRTEFAKMPETSEETYRYAGLRLNSIEYVDCEPTGVVYQRLNSLIRRPV